MVPNMPHSDDVTTRRRKNITTTDESTTSQDSPRTKPIEAVTTDINNNNHNTSELKEDEFDAEITTLGTNATEQIQTVTEKLAHDAALTKLKEIGSKTPILPSEIGTDFNYKRQVVWPNAIGFLILHLCALVGMIIPLFGFADVRTLVYGNL